ncbi:SDR family oxidoreductase [Pseudohalioglobus sediminis]|uniref:SDR family oxidoreductase n=1 Tax=Pseudohalioglobus sediminis TaxID=2606449 RepID=A0A5B0X398_9GAMM|nr:SDR family oxidoreductase [Pseudohalioglobus sediminis]KAA1193098.1 SDR family oxidoreductase [Pseudohalioglobus sediminis]
MDLQLQGKTALVTGSDKRTGETIAEALAAEGASVIFHGNDVCPARPLAVEGDVTSEAGCERVLEQVAAMGLGIDILVNNYGTTDNHRWQEADTAKWLEMYQVNVLSAVRMSQGCIAAMKARNWGRIINLGTVGTFQPAALRPAYYSAKGALATMAVSLARELAGTGITVNTVSPGFVRTEQVEAGYRRLARKLGRSEDWDEVVKLIVERDFPNPCGRIAERQEVADLVTFLCSPRADFINGQNLRIDGGAH